MSEDYQSLLRDDAIKHKGSAAAPCWTPIKMGTAERNWCTVLEMVQCMLIGSGLLKELWPHAARTAAIVRNRCYCMRTGETSHFLFSEKRSDCQELKNKRFGSECMV